jgi:aminoglycoside phosphotransferase (APT) family kinase protein
MLNTNGDRPACVGVVDWELADSHGLPGCDLFFFLTYVAFALHRTRENGRHVEAFHSAFFGPEAWAKVYVQQYTERVGLPPQALTPLFVLTWVRYLASLLVRLEATVPAEAVDEETAAWLRQNRYYALWQHAMAHQEKISFAR